MEPTGSEKVLNKMNVTINLLILTTAVLVLVLLRGCRCRGAVLFIMMDFPSDIYVYVTNIVCD